MKLNKGLKQGMAAAVAVCMTAGGFAGYTVFGGEVKESVKGLVSLGKEDLEAEGTDGMGRYLEEDLNLPEGCQSPSNLSFLEDGTMRMIYRGEGNGIYMADSKDNGETWGEGTALMEKIGLESGELAISSTAIAKDGGVFAVVMEMKGEEVGSDIGWQYFYLTPEGEAQKLDIQETMGSDYIIRCKFTDKGTVLLLSIGNGVKEINPADGSLVASYEEGSSVENFGVAGNRLLLIVDKTIHYYDLETGKPADDASSLTEQISSEPSNLDITSTTSYPLLFTEGDEADSLFYMDKNGVYRYAFGGNVVEKVIDGSLNSINSPDAGFVDFVRDKDGGFYLTVEDFSSGTMQGRIFKYVYSKDTPAVPDTELTIYSLRENFMMRQVAAIFQKKYPDIYLNLETGMTGDDAVTTTDALKTLNTEIMAGKGPDILILDGIPENTYIEKGMLEDLSGLLKDAGILENIRDAYTNEDGSIYCMPAKFGIPIVMGQAEDLNKIEDLKTLADAVESHKEEYTEQKMPMLMATEPRLLLKSLSDVCSPAWLKEDGTLDEAAVTEYLEQANRIYQTGRAGAEKRMQEYGEEGDRLADEYQRSDFGISGSAMSMLGGMEVFGIGGLYSPSDLATIDSTKNKETSLDYKLLNGQASNCFLPAQLVGVSAKSEEKEAAEAFVQFLFSEEGQEIGKQAGYPVNQTVYESEEYWNAGNSEGAVSSISSSNVTTGETLSLEIKQPSQEVVSQAQEIGKGLTVPVSENEIILGAISDAGARYLKGEASLEEAASAVIQQVNLYLSE